MPFKGILQRGAEVNIMVTTPGANAGSTATTLHKVLKIPQLQNIEIVEVDVLTTPPNAGGQLTERFGNNVVRIVLAVTPPIAGAATVRVTQGLNVFEDPITSDTTFVYDVA